MNEFIKYKKNITSQWGEDGIIEEIFNRIGVQDGLCIEFGAWDAKHLSNVWNLWHENNWSALLIEGDEKKYKDLLLGISNFKKVKPYCAYVKSEGENSLDNIINKTFPNKNIDLISIDIDGNDYYIFESLRARPRVIIIEYNPTIPLHLELIQDHDQYFGSSISSMYKLAKSKNYKLVTITETNMFLVTEEEFSKLNIEEQKVEDIFISDYLTYIITGYDGTPVINKMPTYLNINKKTNRIIKFKNADFKTVNLNIYKGNILKKYINKFIEKILNLLKKNTRKNLQSKRVIPWIKINGDKTLRLDYDLNQDSIVVDVGGYEGQWASDIYAKYSSNIIIFEPVEKFYKAIKDRFSKNNKITVYGIGLSNDDKDVEISLLGDSSSLFKENETGEKIKIVGASTFLREKNIEKIDLMKINIEGSEYDLLEDLIESNFIKNIKNIQVQFHDFIPNAEKRMKSIQDKLSETHYLTYQYEFVWENWERNEK